MLEGDTRAISPDEWFVSRVCEEFPAYTIDGAKQAIADDDGTLLTIMELRSFRSAHQALQHAADHNVQVKATPMMARVMALQIELMQNRGH